MSIIVDVYAREVLDSRGNPTVEVEVSSNPAAKAARSFRPAPPPALTKLSSFVTETKAATSAKAS